MEKAEKKDKKEQRRRRKQRMARLYTYLRYLYCATPFVLGVYGYLQFWPKQYWNSLYAALALYGASCEVENPNLPLEIARWWAIAVTGSGVVFLIHPLRERLLRFWIRICGGTIVYGSSFYTKKLAEDIRLEEGGCFPRVILIEEGKASPAGRQVVMLGNGADNFLFYQNNRAIFADSQVYINMETIYPVGVVPYDVNAFSISEGMARLYWKSYPLFPCEGEDKSRKIEIGLIGFGNLGQNLLVYGLLRNVYHRKQKIVYHIWGKTEDSFLWQHKVFAEKGEQKDDNNEAKPLFLDGTEDCVVFHKQDWSAPIEIEQIKKLDRLIFCEDHENYKNMGRFLYLLSTEEVRAIGGGRTAIHMKLGEGESFEIAGDVKTQFCFFGRHEEVATKDCIIQESLLQEAKEMNLSYQKEKHKGENYQKNAEQAWNELEHFFDRSSNIVAADYKDVLCALLRECLRQKGKISEEDRQRLAALEHMRWCRFHWWNNWSSDSKEGTKDVRRRRHPALCPYEELSKQEQRYNLERVEECLQRVGIELESVRNS
ncbi:MAG: RyR domain-containing protein [bacterium]|nr:RyR domain-containing protein [bacterium]